jgi:hypothetical protein
LDADQAFARLDELISRLPDMQEADARFMRARKARGLREARDHAAALEAEIEGYQTTLDQALVAAKASADADDSDAAAHKLLQVRAYDELRYTRLATAQRAQDKLRDLLKTGTLTLEDPLDEYALSDAEYAALESQLLSFQAEYLQVFKHCKRLKGLTTD